MFNIITPQVGDRILINCFYSVTPGFFNCSLLATDRPRYRDGIRPKTFGGDQFHNKNCDHFNIKGTLVNIDFPGVKFSLGKQYIAEVYPSVVNRRLPDWLVFGSMPATEAVIAPRVDYERSLPRMYNRQPWPKKGYDWNDRKILIKWLSSTKCKVTYYNYVGGEGRVTTGTKNDSYVEFSPDYVQRRQITFTGLDAKASTPKWIDPINPFVVHSLVYRMSETPRSSGSLSASVIFQRTRKIRMFLQSNDSSSFGFLTVESAQSLKVLDMNLGLYLADFFRLKGTVLSFLNGLKGLSWKGLSNAYLSYHYGLRLTYKDTMSIIESYKRPIEHLDNDVTRSRGRLRREDILDYGFGPVTVFTSYNMMLYCRVFPHWFAEITNYFLSIDLFPTLELTWDLIPFSFVVDWFLKVGDELEAIDTRTLLSTYDILSCVYSRRSEFNVDIRKLFPELAERLSGELTIVDYHRTVSSTCPPYQPTSGLMPTRPFTHWVEGAALILQRL